MSDFNEDQIRRDGLPADVFGLLHDLCYHVNNNLRGSLDDRAVANYVERARAILRSGVDKTDIFYQCKCGHITSRPAYWGRPQTCICPEPSFTKLEPKV